MIGHSGLIGALREARTDHLAIVALTAVIAGDDLQSAITRVEQSLEALPKANELRKAKVPRKQQEIARRVHEFGPEIVTGLRAVLKAEEAA